MPYQVRKGGQDCPFEVIKEGSGERVACHATEEEAKKHMSALYANVSDAGQRSRPVIEWRSARMEDVNIQERIIRVIAVPYEQRTQVPIGNELWNEQFLYGAFSNLGAQERQRFSVNRDHDKHRTIGRVVNYDAADPKGLIIESRISPTELGEETLILAADDALGGSVGFSARRSDCIWDRNTMTRSVQRAYLDHLAFVPDPAYEGAQVLSVRNGEGDDSWQPVPAVDEVKSDPMIRWAQDRLEKRADKKPYGDVKYADPKNGKYPIDTEEHARAALSYFSMPKNHAGYTADEIAAIMGRIKAACKRFGIQVAD